MLSSTDKWKEDGETKFPVHQFWKMEKTGRIWKQSAVFPYVEYYIQFWAPQYLSRKRSWQTKAVQQTAIKMAGELEHTIQRPGVLEHMVCSTWRLTADTTSNLLLNSYREHGAGLPLMIHSRRARDNRQKQQQGEFSLGMTTFIPRVVMYCNFLLEELWDHHSWRDYQLD